MSEDARLTAIREPLNEIEKAELLSACQQVLKPAGLLLLRRAFYELDLVTSHARAVEGREQEEETVMTISVFKEDDGRFAAEYHREKEAGMGEYSATVVGALANLCSTLIKVDEDVSVERREVGEARPHEPEQDAFAAWPRVAELAQENHELRADLTALRAERDSAVRQFQVAERDCQKMLAELAEARARLAVPPQETKPCHRRIYMPNLYEAGEVFVGRCELANGHDGRCSPRNESVGGLAVPPQDQVIVYPVVGVSISHEPEGRLALPAWQAELRDRMEKFLRGGDDSDQQGIDLGERVRGWLSLLPPPAAEGETRCDLDPLANVNEMGTGNIK